MIDHSCLIKSRAREQARSRHRKEFSLLLHAGTGASNPEPTSIMHLLLLGAVVLLPSSGDGAAISLSVPPVFVSALVSTRPRSHLSPHHGATSRIYQPYLHETLQGSNMVLRHGVDNALWGFCAGCRCTGENITMSLDDDLHFPVQVSCRPIHPVWKATVSPAWGAALS